MIGCYSRFALCTALLGPIAYETSARTETGDSLRSTATGITAPRDAYPDMSPDGKRIVFQSNRTGTWQLWIINTDGTGLLRLTHSDGQDTSPVWSPDGTEIMFAFDGWPAISPNGEEIAFASNRGEGGIFHLYLMAADGSHVRQITQGTYNYTQPAWSADGKRLAAFRWLEDEAGEIGHIVIIDLPNMQ